MTADPSFDGAEPSGNSVALQTLLRLHEYTTEEFYRQRAEGCFAAFAAQISRAPVALPQRLAQTIPFLEGELALQGKTTAFVCERGRSDLPTSDPEVFAQQITRVRALLEEGTPPPLPVSASRP